MADRPLNFRLVAYVERKGRPGADHARRIRRRRRAESWNAAEVAWRVFRRNLHVVLLQRQGARGAGLCTRVRGLSDAIP